MTTSIRDCHIMMGVYSIVHMSIYAYENDRGGSRISLRVLHLAARRDIKA